MNYSHLVIQDLSLHYGSNPYDDFALGNINLEVNRGELVGLLGPSGCGKTTLLRLIAGFEIPTKGRIYINQEEVSNRFRLIPPERRSVGMVFQDYALFPHLNAWDNASFGIRSRENYSRVDWLLDLLGLGDLKERFPHELSGGQRQRLALARALAPGTSLVLLDEPFSSLDVEVRLRLRCELSSVLRSCEATGILVTHDPQEALAICDRVAILRDGMIQQFATPNQIVNKPSNPFVASFALKKNVLPAKSENGILLTPLGPLLNHNPPTNVRSLQLVFDENALEIHLDSNGDCLVQGKEFLENYFLLRIKLQEHVLRVSQPLDCSLNIGDRCMVNFRNEIKSFIFPLN